MLHQGLTFTFDMLPFYVRKSFRNFVLYVIYRSTLFSVIFQLMIYCPFVALIMLTVICSF